MPSLRPSQIERRRLEHQSRQRRAAASRANAAKSTGPRTASGKLRSSQNALIHGLASPFTAALLLPGEDHQALQELTDTMYHDYRPVTVMEAVLINRMIVAQWRFERALRLEGDAVTLRALQLHHSLGHHPPARIFSRAVFDLNVSRARPTLNRYLTLARNLYHRSVDLFDALRRGTETNLAPAQTPRRQ